MLPSCLVPFNPTDMKNRSKQDNLGRALTLSSKSMMQRLYQSVLDHMPQRGVIHQSCKRGPTNLKFGALKEQVSNAFTRSTTPRTHVWRNPPLGPSRFCIISMLNDFPSDQAGPRKSPPSPQELPYFHSLDLNSKNNPPVIEL